MPAAPTTDERAPGPLSHLAVLAAMLLVTALIVRCAWVSDDAYVTIRTVDNWVNGHGLRFNPLERVQAYTHPLWMGMLAAGYAATRDGWWMPMALGVATSVAALGTLAFGVARDRVAATVAVALLGASKAFVDYGTSGLENPLENLVLAALMAAVLRPTAPRPEVLGLLGSALWLTRPDGVLIGLPWLAVGLRDAARARGPRSLWRVALGLSPALAWEAFSLVYYGALIPNTALAKLATDLPAGELWAQGGWYFAWTAGVDPPTLVLIVLGAVAGLLSRDPRGVAASVGLLLHCGWVASIGGDFMGGRFLVAPLWVAVMALSRWRWRPLPAGLAVALALGGSALLPYSPLRSTADYQKAKPAHGVVDERGYYWRGTGLWAPGAGSGPTHEFYRDGRAARGKPIAVKSVIGLYGYAAGPNHHVVDRLGLSDPLLARLPAEADPQWRIGHFRRKLPDGYTRAVLAKDPKLSDPEIDALYRAVRLATRGDLWTAERWRAIVGLHTGAYPIDRERWRTPSPEPK